jgi:hypothetical protein
MYTEDFAQQFSMRFNFNGSVRAYLTGYRVLQAASDPRAGQVIQTAYQVLEERASRLDGELRRAFLENIPAHRELLQAWEAWLDRTSSSDLTGR